MRFDQAHGLKTSMSIGYRVIKDAVVDGIRQLKEISLHEGSLVGIGANSMANVTVAKHLKDAQNAQLSDLLQQLKDSYKWLPPNGSARR